MSLLARSAAPLRQVAVRARTAPVRSMHGEYKHIPFDYDKKVVFGVKVAAYLIGGFSIPFVAAYYQLSKSAGAS
ncbi:hypothetical protein C8Q80DRAFT_1268575 [Daedaleopsis nitida]|nr:hypothetical protein C8Q80DRAFT_1268575 [Daedaleopsis nitida]